MASATPPPSGRRFPARGLVVALVVVLAVAAGAFAVIKLTGDESDKLAAYHACSQHVHPAISAMQDLSSRLDIGLNEGDYSNRVGDVKVVYDRIPSAGSDSACAAVVKHLGDAMDQYSHAASKWNNCIQNEFCTEPNVQPIWLKAQLDVAEAIHALKGMKG